MLEREQDKIVNKIDLLNAISKTIGDEGILDFYQDMVRSADDREKLVAEVNKADLKQAIDYQAKFANFEVGEFSEYAENAWFCSMW